MTGKATLPLFMGLSSAASAFDAQLLQSYYPAFLSVNLAWSGAADFIIGSVSWETRQRRRV